MRIVDLILTRTAQAGVTYTSQILARIGAGPGARPGVLDVEEGLVYGHKAATGAKPPAISYPDNDHCPSSPY